MVLYYNYSTFLSSKVYQATVFKLLFNVENFFLIITKWDPLVLYIRVVVGVEVY